MSSGDKCTPSLPAKPARHLQSVTLTALLSDVVSEGQDDAAATPPGQNDPAEHGSHTSTPPCDDPKVPAKHERSHSQVQLVWELPPIKTTVQFWYRP